jgi:hypothetical protein
MEAYKQFDLRHSGWTKVKLGSADTGSLFYGFAREPEL